MSSLDMIIVLSLFMVHNGISHYCDSPGCPSFTLMKFLQVKSISSSQLELEWESKEEFSVWRYEVHWFAENDCDKCTGKISLFDKTTSIFVKPCTPYGIEVYGFDISINSSAPLMISQTTAPSSLTNGSVVQTGDGWTVLRWLTSMQCHNSTHVAVCVGPDTQVAYRPFHPDNVVLLNFSTLHYDANYTCVAYTINSAGSSCPAAPIYLRTKKGPTIEDSYSPEKIFVLVLTSYSPEKIFVLVLTVSSLLIVISSSALYYRKSIMKMFWRRKYVVNEVATQ